MAWFITVYSTTDGNDDIQVEVPDEIEYDDIEAYIEENYPTVGEWQADEA